MMICIALIFDVLKDCILAVLKSMPSNKAPDPDGYSVEFFRATWKIVRDHVTAAIQEFSFLLWVSYEAVECYFCNSSAQVSSSKKVTDCRHISCCNIIYKCFSKLLADRLNRYFPCLIRWNQSAFTVDKKIMDNILLAQQIVRDNGQKNGKP